MTTDTLPEPSGGLVRLLLQICIYGIDTGQVARTLPLIRYLRRRRPDLPHPALLEACSSPDGGGAAEAVVRLARVRDEYPDCPLATAIQALTMKQVGMSGWRGLAESVVAEGSDETACRLAMHVLDRDYEERGDDAFADASPPVGVVYG